MTATFEVLEHLDATLEPLLGYAEHCSRVGRGLRCYSTDDLNRLDSDDWADSLDGIRLEWNEDATNEDDSKMPGRIVSFCSTCGGGDVN